MNQRKAVSHRCDTENNKTNPKKKDNPEVLVLPPDLLEKLGINLETIPATKNCSTKENGEVMKKTKESNEHSHGKSDINTAKVLVNNDSESSILETANLMKASVLLSPTFNNLKSITNSEYDDISITKAASKCVNDVESNNQIMESNNHVLKTYKEKAISIKNARSEDNPNAFCNDVVPENDLEKITTRALKEVTIPESFPSSHNENCIESAKMQRPQISENTYNYNVIPVATDENGTKNTDPIDVSDTLPNIKIQTNTNVPNRKDDLSTENSLHKVKSSNVRCNKEEELKKHLNVPTSADVSPQRKDIKECIKLKVKEVYRQLLNNRQPQESEKGDTNSSQTCNKGCNSSINTEITAKLSVAKESDELGSQSLNMQISSGNSQNNYSQILINSCYLGQKNKSNHTCNQVNCTCSDCCTDQSHDTGILSKNTHTDTHNNCNSNSVDKSLEFFPKNNTSVDELDDATYSTRNFNTDSNKQCCSNKNINTKQSKGYTKLSIQGVEKPGGDIYTNLHASVANIKTYSKSKKINVYKNDFCDLIDCSKNDVNVDIDYKTVNNLNLTAQKLDCFCLCDDFGSFVHYDSDNNYKHIHFWQPKQSHCPLDILLSIYEDKKCENINEQEINEIFEPVGECSNENKDTINEPGISICWNGAENCKNIIENIYFSATQEHCKRCDGEVSGETEKNNHFNDELNKVSQSNNSSNGSVILDTTNEIVTYDACESNDACISDEDEVLMRQNVCAMSKNSTKKRKRLRIMSESESDSEKQCAKKVSNIFICEVCSNKVSNTEWDDHVTKEHYCIAWTKGQKIDLENGELISKLNRRLCDTKKLICTFCNIEMYNVHSFINHVRKCIEIKCNDKSNGNPKKGNLIVIKVLPSPLDSNGDRILEIHKTQEKSNDDQHFEVPLLEPQTVKDSIVDVSPIQTVDEGCIAENSKRNVSEQSDNRENVNTNYVIKVEVPILVEKRITCGVCHKDIEKESWIEHIGKEHNYIAWEDGKPPLDNEERIRKNLNDIIKKIGKLVCNNCGMKRKFAKSYLKHIQNCETKLTENENQDQSQTLVKKDTETDGSSDDIVQCGVCEKNMANDMWRDHIFKEHDYLAWKKGKPKVDVNDSKEVFDHLNQLSKEIDGLTCGKCGRRRKYVKSYLKHIETCDGVPEENTNYSVSNSSLNDSRVYEELLQAVDANVKDLSDDEDGAVTCGVCKTEVEGKNWLNHIHKQHSYLAWKEGKPPLDLTNDFVVQQYLNIISKKYKGLTCNKCGLNRKYVKVFLAHIESCDASVVPETVQNRDSYECAVCSEVLDAKDWKLHAMKKHYNVAWAKGDYPIDYKNFSMIEKLLMEYKQHYSKLKCRTCGVSRASTVGFYAHVIQCGKSEQEIDQHRVYCEKCDSKYLMIYKYQHASLHRDQETAKQRKLEMHAGTEPEQMTDRRRAAERALQHIEQSESYAHNCATCGYGADDELEMQEHVCSKTKNRAASDSEDSVKLEFLDDDESADSCVDSNISDEEDEVADRRRRKHGDSTSAASRVPRVPFPVQCANTYLKRSAHDFRKVHLTSDVLYPQWRSCSIEAVADDEVSKYLPTVAESCKVILGKTEARTFQRFEVTKDYGYVIFVGGSIQCISWAPPHVDSADDGLGRFLAVVSHNSADSPRLDWANTYRHPGLLQIWDYGDGGPSMPEFAFGIAHDYGTIWAADWCMSGARDDLSESSPGPCRLGLLAIACSNGSCYILSVPYPATVKTSDKLIYKVTPVAELRLTRGERQLFQATSISWSSQKGHSTIMAGYSDGTTALYNLECDSPLLLGNEGGMNIFYPFKDERPHNSCITDVKTFPSTEGAGLVSSVAPTGGASAQLRGAARVHGHLSASSAAYVPHWPSLLLSGNDVIVNQAVNELDWWGNGRRTGGVQRLCGCLQCGHTALFAPPVLKLLTTHPAYPDLNKKPIAVFQMKRLGKKRLKKKNDELQLMLEPLSYDEAVTKYALDFKRVKDIDKVTLQDINKTSEQYPERYPLNEVTSMTFYPSYKQHRELSVGTHAGFVFQLNV